MIWLTLVVLGLAFGSFVNALVFRLRQQGLASPKSKKSKVDSRYSIIRGRSMCPHCRHELAWYDLIPVISWLGLKGRCRYCNKPISWQYPVVELGTALLFVGSYLAWPQVLEVSELVLFSFWLVFLTSFVALTVYDLKWMLLPNRIVYPLIGLAAVQLLFKMITEGDALGLLASALWGFLAIGGFFYVLFQMSGGKWIGGGDVKLGFMIGLLVGGPLNSLFVIFLASVLGTLVAIPGLVRKSLKATSRLPFGPFLLAATVVVYLYGERITDWYVNSLLW